MQFDAIQKFCLWAIPMLFAITVHEVAHGWIAKLRGDKTASMLGRLTLNPLKHIDPIGTILLPLLLYFTTGYAFGWAKPVPVDWRNLKSPRMDMALVAIAGPVANLLMAIAWGLFAKLGLDMAGSSPWLSAIMVHMGLIGAIINFILMVFNLLPLPPLDGSRIITSCLPVRAAYRYNLLERYGFFILLLLLALGWYEKFIGPVVSLLFMVLTQLLGINL